MLLIGSPLVCITSVVCQLLYIARLVNHVCMHIAILQVGVDKCRCQQWPIWLYVFIWMLLGDGAFCNSSSLHAQVHVTTPSANNHHYEVALKKQVNHISVKNNGANMTTVVTWNISHRIPPRVVLSIPLLKSNPLLRQTGAMENAMPMPVWITMQVYIENKWIVSQL
jgi:hypothetical protein